jgi:hypothetical protein
MAAPTTAASAKVASTFPSVRTGRIEFDWEQFESAFRAYNERHDHALV